MLEHLSVENCFALLFTVRTGSHLCKSALISHPEIQQIWAEKYTSDLILEDKQIITPQPFMTGLKLASPYLYEKERIHEVTCPKIATYRNNKLSQLISFLLARRENLWGDTPYSDEHVRVPIRKGIYWINTWIAAETAIREAFSDQECLWVEYGDLASGKAHEEMQRHLGLDVVDLVPIRKKQAQKPNIEYVENIDEVLNSELAGWV